MTTRRRMTAAVLTFAMLGAGGAGLAQDDLSVVVDPRADFSLFRTFKLIEGQIRSDRPELDNRLFEKKLATTIRAALISRGLVDAADRPDLTVHFSVTGQDVSTSQRGVGRGDGPRPLMFTVGMLVIDLMRPDDPTPVWRGVYRDDESTGSKLVQKLPEDATRLIDRYPKRRK